MGSSFGGRGHVFGVECWGSGSDFRDRESGFGVWFVARVFGSGFEVASVLGVGADFGTWGLGVRLGFLGSGFRGRVLGVEGRVLGVKSRFGAEFWRSGVGFRESGFGGRVLGVGFWGRRL